MDLPRRTNVHPRAEQLSRRHWHRAHLLSKDSGAQSLAHGIVPDRLLRNRCSRESVLPSRRLLRHLPTPELRARNRCSDVRLAESFFLDHQAALHKTLKPYPDRQLAESSGTVPVHWPSFFSSGNGTTRARLDYSAALRNFRQGKIARRSC